MTLGELHERNQDINSLLDSAPSFIARAGDPKIVTDANSFEEAMDVSSPWARLTEGAQSLLQRLKGGTSPSPLFHLQARDVLKLGLETPKHADDHDAYWFYELPGRMTDLLTEAKFGRRSLRASFLTTSGQMFRSNTERWQQNFRQLAEYHSLFEAGVIIEGGDGGLHAIAISLPWDETRTPWQMRLTVPRPFVGREKELNAFAQMVAGKDYKDIMLEHTFNPTNTETWWTMAKMQNKIAKRDQEATTRPRFAERVIRQLREIFKSKTSHQLLKDAKGMWGYNISAYASTVDGHVHSRLAISNDWLERLEPVPEKERTEPPSSKQWIFGAGSLYNTDDLHEPKELAFFIILDKAGGIKELQVTKYFPGRRNAVQYFVGSETYGDSYCLYGRWGPDVKHAKPIDRSHWEIVQKAFERAKRRAALGDHYVPNRPVNPDPQEMLSDEAQSILEQVATLIQQKADQQPN